MLRRLSLLVLFAFAAPGFASDGVLEINQTCAVETGCVANDLPGFPVTMDAPGSYRLTSDLEVPDLATDGLIVSANFIQIDLNGFSIRGPGSCDFASCPGGTGRGIGQSGSAGQISITNGFVRGVGSHGIEINSGAVERVTVAAVGGDGIVLGSGLVRGNRISVIGGTALRLATEFVSYSDNFIGLIGLAGSGDSIEGGRDAGGNSCVDGSCDPRGLRRFYFQVGPIAGNQALTSCAAGFHMASIWEIIEPGQLHYDRTLGGIADDSGWGPPNIGATILLTPGWVRTGARSATFGGGGLANCGNWTDANPSSRGSVAALPNDLNTTSASPSAPWIVYDHTCTGIGEFTTVGVWCIQD